LQQDNDDNEKANNNMNDGDQYNHLFQTTRPAQPALSRLKGKNSGTEWGFRKIPFCHLPFHVQLNCKLRFHPMFMRSPSLATREQPKTLWRSAYQCLTKVQLSSKPYGQRPCT
jgi:hypothetical protein